MEFGVNIMATLSKKFGLSKRHAVLLKVASIFADTGYYININDYSKYSYDIVKSNPIIGLSQKEHEVISGAVLFQNGIFDFNEYNVYSKNRRLLISKLAAIVSLASHLMLNTIKNRRNKNINKKRNTYDNRLYGQ